MFDQKGSDLLAEFKFMHAMNQKVMHGKSSQWITNSLSIRRVGPQVPFFVVFMGTMVSFVDIRYSLYDERNLFVSQ